MRFESYYPLNYDMWSDINTAAHKSEAEACGILVGDIIDGVAHIKEVRKVKNIASNPAMGFVFDPQEYHDSIIDTYFYDTNAKYALLGIWHTHPNFPGYPSKVDWNAALRGQVVEGMYLIFSTKGNDIYHYYWDGNQFIVMRPE